MYLYLVNECLCKFCLNGWFMKNSIYDHNRLFGLNVQVSEFIGAFWGIVSKKYWKMCKIDQWWIMYVMAKIRENKGEIIVDEL